MPGKVPLNFRDRVDAWEKFAQRHSGNLSLELDPLYPLPEELIDAIIEEAPRFFTEKEQAFERELAALARDNSNFDRGQAETERELRDMLAEEMKAGGSSELQVGRYLQAEDERREAIESRIEAFAGWLVTDPQFRGERDKGRE
jgi:hypothetical protein